MRVLFHRDYRHFSGGHLKVRDYFEHTRNCSRYQAEIYLEPGSAADHPWRGVPGVVDRYDPTRADILFIAGMDWAALDACPGIEERIPVVNLVQGLRHAKPDGPLFGFLGRRATRICVSAEVAQALEATGACNGPIHVIPNGIDFSLLPEGHGPAEYDVFISGLKQPRLAAELAARLQAEGYSVACQVQRLPRGDFLERLARARVAVLLPLREEGFYIPALEAMAMGLPVICPDCGGNRSFCIGGETALTPEPALEPLAMAVREVMRNPALAEALRRNGREMSLRHDIRTEREAFLTLLQQIGLP